MAKEIIHWLTENPELELVEPVQMSFYPEYEMVKIRRLGHHNHVVSKDHAGIEREFDIDDTSMLPAQDLLFVLEEIDRFDKSKIKKKTKRKTT